jgi:small subunit ribosomal protein S1
MENFQENTEEKDANDVDEASGATFATQLDGEEGSEQTMESLMEMYEESLKRFEEGEVVNGRIISVDKDHVLVDVGYKSEGLIPINEFRDSEGNIQAAVDDDVEVMIEWWDEEEERVLLSKEKAAKVKVWAAINEVHEADGTIEGVITHRV